MPERIRHIEKSFINGKHLDQGRVLAQFLENRLRGLDILSAVSGHDDRMRTQPLRLTETHARFDTVRPRLVTCGRHHTAREGVSTHQHGFAANQRISALLHGRKKRVHIDVENDAVTF